MNTVSRLALSCAALLALSACGNKGPLVLPEKPAPVETPAPATPATTDPTQPAAVGEQGATLPVQVQPQDTTTAPTSDDEAADKAADKAVDDGGTDGDG